MSLKEIKQKLKEIFSSMKAAGLIIIPEDFKKIKSRYFGKRRTDLTRIWGAEYLRDKINKSKNLQDHYDVPEYVIVAKDTDHLKIKFWFGNGAYPMASSLENASNIFREDFRKTNCFLEQLYGTRSWEKSGIGYDDFSDPGNITQDNISAKNTL